MAFVIVLLVVLVVAVVVVIVMRRSRSTTSSVDSFRRHIDALGPEARRTTVDQVQSAAARSRSERTRYSEFAHSMRRLWIPGPALRAVPE